MPHGQTHVKPGPTKFNPLHFLHPRYWLIWLGLGLLRLIVLLPYNWQLRIGTLIGQAMKTFAPRRRRIAATNIALCFPDLDARAQKDLVRRNFAAVGIALIETAMSWWESDAQMQQLHRFEGEEHLQQALQQGKGVLLLGGHYTTLEISGRLMASHTHDLQPIYKPARNRLFNAMMEKARNRLFDKLLLNTDFRGIVRSLKHNKLVWYAPDQDFGADQIVFAPFMNIPAVTLTMTARLAKVSGAPVLPFYSQRLPGSQGYLIKLLPPLENFPSGDDVVDATQVNAAIERQVRAAPEQYLWLHRRFKTRPPGEPDFYANKGIHPRKES